MRVLLVVLLVLVALLLLSMIIGRHLRFVRRTQTRVYRPEGMRAPRKD